MSANSNAPAIDNTVEQNGGVVWNRLHSERADICEALLKEPLSGSGINTMSLQARLRKIDDALDRLMSGSYGDCSKCGKWIEDTKLDFDPAIALCLDCWEHEQRRTGAGTSLKKQISPSPTGVALAALAPFDTIRVRTVNSSYRIFLLDPGNGRALVEGGILAKPVEALVSGSTLPDCSIKKGEIGPGHRLEMWVNRKLVSTSPIQSVRVEHFA